MEDDYKFICIRCGTSYFGNSTCESCPECGEVNYDVDN